MLACLASQTRALYLATVTFPAYKASDYIYPVVNTDNGSGEF